MIVIRRYKVNDLVSVLGKGTYEIKGYHQEIYFSQGKMIETNHYQLQNYETKVDCGYFDEMVLTPAKNISISKEDFNLLLDEYNDLMRMYDEFKESTYLNQATTLIKSLHKYKIK